MYSAHTADARIAAAENVLTKFADTEFKAEALYFEAASYGRSATMNTPWYSASAPWRPTPSTITPC